MPDLKTLYYIADKDAQQFLRRAPKLLERVAKKIDQNDPRMAKQLQPAIDILESWYPLHAVRGTVNLVHNSGDRMIFRFGGQELPLVVTVGLWFIPNENHPVLNLEAQGRRVISNVSGIHAALNLLERLYRGWVPFDEYAKLEAAWEEGDYPTPGAEWEHIRKQAKAQKLEPPRAVNWLAPSIQWIDDDLN
jgi:hypothetical protein